MKKISKTLCLLLILPLTSCQKLDKFEAYDNAENYKVINKSGEIYNSSLKNIDISWVKGNINIIPTQEYNGVTIKEFTTEIFEDDYMCHVYRDADFLSVKYCASDVSIPNNVIKDLTIYVPEGITLGNISIEGVSNSINISSIYCETLTINNVSGKVNIDNVGASKIIYDGVSGNLSAVLNESTLEIDIDQVSGSSIVSLPENTKGFITTFNTTDGKFTSDFEVTSEEKKYVYDNGNRYQLLINFDSVDGNLFVSKHKASN